MLARAMLAMPGDDNSMDADAVGLAKAAISLLARCGANDSVAIVGEKRSMSSGGSTPLLTSWRRRRSSGRVLCCRTSGAGSASKAPSLVPTLPWDPRLQNNFDGAPRERVSHGTTPRGSLRGRGGHLFADSGKRFWVLVLSGKRW